MPDLPTGTVTFLLTDIEGSTSLWEREPAAMGAAAARHDALIEQAVTEQGGVVVRPRGEGDSRFAVFARASDAVAAALVLQWDLAAEPWPTSTPLRVRVALHTGEAELREGDYYGTAINRCARLRAVAHGGQALLSQATTELVGDRVPPPATLQDLGEHRLRDLVRAEHIYQLAQPGVPVDFPPLRSLDTLPNNLPLQLTSFVGREREMAEVRRLIGSTRLLTLTGSGGCGKTRLALQVAAEMVEHYADGVWFVEFAPLADPDLVARTVAGVLQVSETPAQPLLASLLASLHGKRLLLALDNCEHLLDACARLADLLLRGCPDLTVLATSREALGIAGETAWRVPSLSLPDVQHLPSVAQVTQYQAVRLFIERAVAVRPDFAVTSQNAAAVAQVCWRLDGIPLALELAAARLTALTVEQVAVRLDDRFRLLTGGRRTAVRRQQTLQATIDWSHDLLTKSERVLLRRLAVFAGGFTLAAAEAVGAGDGVDGDEVLDLLTRLVEKSLVVADAAGGEARYRLLETVRQYTGDKLLAAGEAEAVRDRHLAWAVALAETAEPALRGREQIAWQERLEAEHDNIRAALRWAGERGDAQAALRLSGSLWHFWEVRGYYMEGQAHYDAALALPGAGVPAAVRALALAGAGVMTFQLGDFPAARQRMEAALALDEPGGAPMAAVLALVMLASILTAQGDAASGLRRTEEALRRATASGDAWAEALALRFLALDAVWRGDQAALRHWTERRRAGVRQLGQPWLEHGLHVDLAGLARLEGDRAGERAHREQVLVLTRALATPRAIAANLVALAALTLDVGDLAAARRYGDEGLRLMRDLGNRWELPRAVEGVAGLGAATGRPAQALRLAGAAAAMRATLTIRPRPAEVENLDRWLAPARQALSQAEQAAAWAEGEALTLDEAVADALAEELTD